MSQAALEAWDHAGTEKLRLPTRMRIKWRTPDLQAHLEAGRIESHLTNVAAKLEYEGLNLAAISRLDDEELHALYELQTHLIRDGIKAVRHQLRWVSVRPTAAWVEGVDGGLPPEDREYLWRRCLHMLDVPDIPEALAERMMGVSSLADFRSRARGDEPARGSDEDRASAE